MTADTKSCFKYSSFNIGEKKEFYDITILVNYENEGNSYV